MVAAAGFGVAGQQVALGVHLAGLLQVSPPRLAVIVLVDEIVARVVGRVDVDHLDCPKVGLVEQLQDFQVFPFDEEMLGLVPIDRLIGCGLQAGCARRLDSTKGVFLACPGEGVSVLVSQSIDVT